MSLIIKARFDGHAIIPEEPVPLPVGQRLEVEVRPVAEERPAVPQLSIEERLERLAQVTGQIGGPSIPLEALRRENLYEERP